MTSYEPLRSGDGLPEVIGERRNGLQPYSLLHASAVILRHRRWVLGIPLVLLTVVAAYLLLKPRDYVAEAAFTPQGGGERGLSRLAGLAAEFGVDVGYAGASESPQFYASLLKSREVLGEVARTAYPFSAGNGEKRLSLLERYRVRGRTEQERLHHAVRRLRRDVAVRVGRETGIIEFAVKAPEPAVAESIARDLLDLVNEFDLERRQTSARAEREFIEGRLAAAREDLRQAEDSLEAFLRQNRRYENSPDLLFQHDRMQRLVAMRQQVYSTLLQGYEQARIDQVRNTPVITLVEPPEGSGRPAPRGLVRRALLALVLGTLGGVLAAFLLEAVRRPEEAPVTSDWEEVQVLWKDTVADFGRPWRRARMALKLGRPDRL